MPVLLVPRREFEIGRDPLPTICDRIYKLNLLVSGREDAVAYSWRHFTIRLDHGRVPARRPVPPMQRELTCIRHRIDAREQLRSVRGLRTPRNFDVFRIKRGRVPVW